MKKVLLSSALIAALLTSCGDSTSDDDNTKVGALTVTPAAFTKTVDENALKGSEIGDLSVEIKDAGGVTHGLDFNHPDYSRTITITAENPAGAIEVSNIGTVTVKDASKFDYEANPSITAKVKIAYTAGSEEFSGTADVTINLNNIMFKAVENIPFSNYTTHAATVFKNQIVVSRPQKVWLSADGATWTAPTTNFANVSRHETIVFNDSIWAIGGLLGGQMTTDGVYNSADGKTWNNKGKVGLADEGRIGHKLVVHNDKLWLIGGTGKTGQHNDVYYLEKGQQIWKQATASATFSARFYHQVVSYKGKMWVIGGRDSQNNSLDEVWSSTDGITWTAESASGLPKVAYHQIVESNGKLWLLGGVIDTVLGSNSDKIYTSSDAISWTEATGKVGFEGRVDHRAVVLNSKIWIIGGNAGDGTVFTQE